MRSSGLWPVLLLSALALEIVILISGPIRTWETASADLLMRWRYSVCQWISPPRDLIHGDITLLAIDVKTQEIMGRFGAGPWLSREPFLCQVRFFEEAFRPTVLSYDILFQDTLGSSARAGERVSESPEKLRAIVEELTKVSESSVASVSSAVLRGLNRFSMEQGNSILAHAFASTRENTQFPSVLGCYFRGGTVDPQPAVVPWSDEDILGSDRTGGEEAGERVPYLRDMAIPAADVHFPNPEAERDYDYSPNASLPSRELLDYTLLGFLNGPRDPDGIVRRIPMVIGFRYVNPITRQDRKVFVPSFSLVTCLLHLGVSFPLQAGAVEVFLGKEIVVHSSRGDFRIPIDDTGRLYLNFNARLEDFVSLSFADVAPPVASAKDRRAAIAGAYRKHLNGHAVLVAVTSAAVDVGNCPLSPNTPLVYVHLTALNNILNRCFVAPLKRSESILLMAALFAVFTTVCYVEKTARIGPAALLFAVFYIVLCYAGVHLNAVILPLIGPLLYIGLCSFSVISYRFLVEERAKRKIRGMFSTMVSGKVLSFLEENPDSFSLKGHNVDTSVFFSDVASFTRISEGLSPERLTQFLNAYLTPVTDCIMEYGGYVDKYVGDGVMAVWGAPFPDPQHAVKACLSALEQQRLIRALGDDLKAEYGVDLRVRMGIGSGRVTAGNMGSEKKFQFTVIGDVVNLASRLEPANKDFGTDIVISETTYRMAKDVVVARALARIVVIGKKEVVEVFELVGEKGKVPPEMLAVIESYEQALQRFYGRDWDGCLALVDGILTKRGDGPASLLRRRALECKAHPPADGWQGEYVRAEKG